MRARRTLSCRCAKLWCTVLPGSPLLSEADRKTTALGRAAAGAPKGAFEGSSEALLRSAGSLPADGLPYGASSSKRGCKEMMLLTRYFRRRAPGRNRPCYRSAAGLPAGRSGLESAELAARTRRHRSRKPTTSRTTSGRSSSSRISRVCSGAAALCDRAVPGQPEPGAEPHRAQHGDRSRGPLVPVLILVIIAIPMYFMDRVPDAEMTHRRSSETSGSGTYSLPDHDFSFANNAIWKRN